MKAASIVASLMMLAVASWCRAADESPPASGLYALTWEGPGRPIKRADADGQLVLGEQLSPKLREARLESLSNDNALLRLSVVAGPIPQGGDVGQMAVLVAGVCVPVSSHGDRTEDGSIAVSGQIVGEGAAAKVAAELGIKPQLRSHPGHRLVVSVKPEKPAYRPKEPVTLVMTIRNVGTTTVRFTDGGMQRGPRNNQFGFTAFRNHGHGKAVPDTGDPTNFGGLGGFVELKPGETFTKTANLSDWFTFDAADAYRVTAMYQFALHGEDHAHPLWDDVAVAACTVRVVEADPNAK
jgi:hypothetical protein